MRRIDYILAALASASCGQAQTQAADMTAESVAAFAQCAAEKAPRRLFAPATEIGSLVATSAQFQIENETGCKLGKTERWNVAEMGGAYAQALFLHDFKPSDEAKMRSAPPVVDLTAVKALPESDSKQSLLFVASFDCAVRSDSATTLKMMQSRNIAIGQDEAAACLAVAWRKCADNVGLSTVNLNPIAVRGELQKAAFRIFVGFKFDMEGVS